MEGLRWVQLPDDERLEFLGRGGTGVLSFATESGRAPVSIPVSYGFDPDEAVFYFQLSTPKDGRKQELVDEPVSFVVHRETDHGWRSVVASGSLTDVTEAPAESALIQGMWAIEIPAVDVFERPRREVTFRYFRLEPETMTGRKEVATDA
ncbi:pyridoxamine 5'-phosphate oxidase family protein [Natronobiforma cellulositropha]|uniref:pyridoxamine 5'-phosphate oxidase family protein n=1 Tax=Natronobiforma cellulositropha TaxID=1679076 RepID=UPI0021D599EC|nr:pyridoxamine 5'-phosphate oxidase family protein [Natronobiforma cellulositropha]